MTFPYFKPMAIACAFVLAVIVAFFAGTAFASEPEVVRSSPDRTEQNNVAKLGFAHENPSSVSPDLYGASSAIAGRLVQAKLFSDWVNGVRFSDAITTQNVGPGPVAGNRDLPQSHAAVEASGPASSGHAVPCGTPGTPTQLPDQIPSGIVQRESQHTVDAWNCGSTASGKYQILDSTFASCGTVYPSAWMAPEAVQDACAATLPSSAWNY